MFPPSATRILQTSAVAAALAAALHGGAIAQAPDLASGFGGPGDTVSWTATAKSSGAIKPGGRAAITLRGVVKDGWHVYGLNQLPAGPTPLRVTVDPSEIAKVDGALSASPPTKLHDPSFDLDTQFYSQAFTVTTPVRIGSRLGAGQQLIPVSVRFQTCDGRICQPPKTVHLSVPVDVRG